MYFPIRDVSSLGSVIQGSEKGEWFVDSVNSNEHSGYPCR